MTATPRPQWEVLGGDGLWYVGTPGYERIRSTSLSSANRVATAVNAHDGLVAENKALREAIARVREERDAIAALRGAPNPTDDDPMSQGAWAARFEIVKALDAILALDGSAS